MPRLAAIADCIDRIIAVIGRIAAWGVLVVVLVEFTVVLLRYGFGIGSIWLQETVVYAHAALFMLAAAWTLAAGGHVRVDIFYARTSARHKAWVDLLGTAFFLLPFMAALRRHHTLHHDPARMGRYHFNISFPVCDRLFGTLYRPRP